MADNPYDTVAVSGYNASPPPDDGSQVPGNLVSWQVHLDKIGDPLKTFGEAINAEVLSSFGELVITNDAGTEQNIIANRMMNFT